MIITSQKFTQIGEALFGKTKWYAVLARMVDHDRTLIWQCATGKTNVSPTLRFKLATICRARGQALLRIADELSPPHSVDPRRGD